MLLFQFKKVNAELSSESPDTHKYYNFKERKLAGWRMLKFWAEQLNVMMESYMHMFYSFPRMPMFYSLTHHPG